MLKYLKAAFTERWNLLAFLGGMAFAFLSGRVDVVGSLVLAAEVAYLGILGTHPKFQKYVDAQEAKSSRQDGREAAAVMVRRILVELPRNLVQRFEAVRTRCAELRQLALQMRDPDRAAEPPPLDDLQLAGLDRLLWMYLRLLFTQYSLSQFLKKTSVEQIEENIHDLEKRLAEIPGNPADAGAQRRRKVVEDNLETSRARLANYKKAEENHELMTLELDRLENTIHSLSELAVNRQEPDFISGQIDQVAKSMVQTERTMGELAFVTGLKLEEESVPPMMRTPAVTSKE